MLKKYLVGSYRLSFGVLAFVAVCVELDRTIRVHAGIVDFFSYFTFESSLLAIVIFLLGGFSALRHQTIARLALWRGAVVVYMTITGVVYTLLLRGPDPTAIPWANELLHYIFPIVIFADWFIDIPRIRISFKQGLIWIIYPLVYLAYTLIRGSYSYWYPYPFINPIIHGYISVARMCVVILVASLCLIGILTVVTRKSVDVDSPKEELRKASAK